jgi:hypothetical protein
MSNIQAYQPIIEDGLGIFPEDLRVGQINLTTASSLEALFLEPYWGQQALE